MNMLKVLRSLSFLAIILLPVFSASAHHSRGNFDLSNVVELQGVISEFTFRNPHSFATMDVENEQGDVEEWLLELNSVTVLRRFGWDGDELAVGDRVRVLGSKDFDESKRFFYSNVFLLEDGTRWTSSPTSQEFANAPAEPETGSLSGQPMQPSQFGGSSGAAEKATSIYGVWRAGRWTGTGARVNNGPVNFLTGELFGPTQNMPLTPAGQTAIDQFNEDDNPEFSCLAPPLPFLVSRGDDMRITESNGVITIRYELMDVERSIYLEESSRFNSPSESWHGFSRGFFQEDGSLLVETSHFAVNPWGNGRGIPSSPQKTATETFQLMNDGRALQVEYEVEDPVYLSEPAIGQRSYTFSANEDWIDYNCDPEASDRHLIED